MALVKCRECGAQISTKADACPKCGARAPKKTSAFTWFMLLFIIPGVYVAYISSSSTSSSSSSGSAQDKEGSSRPTSQPREPTWKTLRLTDEMSGERSSYAISPRAVSKLPMRFPYQGTKAWMGIGCDRDSEWAYIGFTKTPNLSNTKNKNGYHMVRTRFKWDDRLEVLSFTQKWGSESIHFHDQDDAINNASSASKAMLELDWHGQKPVHFEFSLKGSLNAISKIRSECLEY